MKYFFLVLVGTYFSMAQASVSQNFGGGYAIPEGSQPAVVHIFQEKSRCSATLIGPNVLLTAAHCKEAPKGWFKVEGKTYTFTFVTHQDLFPDEKYRDFAIGIIDEVVPVQPLTINFTDHHASKMMALGYGCTKKLSVGFLKFKTNGSETVIWESSDPNDYVFACPGDSGGSVLAYNSSMQLQVVGIQLATDLKSVTFGLKTAAIFAINFFHKAADTYPIQVCGFNLNCD